MNVDLQAMDWQTLVGRRAKQDPPSQGGWNMFLTNWASVDLLNPVMHAGLNARGKDGGWFGWYDDPEMEKMREAFARETDPEKQKQIAVDVQERAYDTFPFLPLGQYTQPGAHRDYVVGLMPSPAPNPLPWGVEVKKK
jgi:peptide/nickel transport system substrate-binding protein